MKRLLSALLFLLLTPATSLASDVARHVPNVFISEVAWAGSAASTADEWFELAGAGAGPIDLSGWTVERASAEPLVFPAGSVIAPGGVFLVANYGADDPKTTLAAAPDLVTTAVALSNSVSHLILRDAAGNVVDEVGASGTPPFAGSTGTAKSSMSRRWPFLPGADPAAWETSAVSSGFDEAAVELGTPGSHPAAPADAPPEASTEEPSPEEAATTTAATPDAVPSATPDRPLAAVRLSEIVPSPADGGPEWIELVNPSGTGEMLDGWTIEDGKGTATALNGLLLPWARLVIEAPKGRLNDDGDLLILKDSRGRTLDRLAYGGWEASAPHVEAPKRGESAMRVEWRDEWTVTTMPTKGAENVLAPRSEPEPAPVRNVDAPIPTPETRSVIRGPGQEEKPVIRGPGSRQSVSPGVVPVAEIATPHAPAISKAAVVPARPTVIPAKAGTQKQTKKPAARYKGRAYEATVAVPPGVYGKTRMLVTIDGRLRELRLNKSTSETYEAGERIRFIAQEKRDGEAEFLLANVNSISSLDLVEEPEFAPTGRWPETSGAFALEGTVSAVEARRLLLLLDGREGTVHLPAAMGSPALKQGDAVRVLGFVSATATPAAYLADPQALTLVKGYVAVKDLPDVRTRLPWTAAFALTALAAVAGVLAYLRHQRIQRLAFAGQTPFEDAEDEA